MLIFGVCLLAGAELVTALALAAGSGATVAIILRPQLGLFFLLICVQTNLAFVAEQHHGIADIGRTLVLFIGGVLLVHGALFRKWPRLNQQTLIGPAVFLLVITLSLFFAEYPARTQEVLLDAIKDVLVLVLVVALMEDMRQFRLAVWAWILAGCFIGTLVTLQTLTGNFDQDFGGFATSAILHIAGEIDAPRPSGPLPDPNFFAQSMLPVVPVALERFLNAKRLPARLFAGWCTIVAVLSIIFSYSRGGMLGLVLLGGLICWRHRRLPVVWLGVAMLAGITIVAMPPDFAARLEKGFAAASSATTSPGQEPSVAGRFGEMAAAVAMFEAHPLLGVGAGNFEPNFQRYCLEHGLIMRGEDRSAHSLYLQAAAEKGILGVAALGYVLFAAARGLFLSRRRLLISGDRETAAMVTAFGTGFLLYLVAALFLHDSFARYFWSYVGVALALPWALPMSDRPRATSLGR